MYRERLPVFLYSSPLGVKDNAPKSSSKRETTNLDRAMYIYASPFSDNVMPSKGKRKNLTTLKMLYIDLLIHQSRCFRVCFKSKIYIRSANTSWIWKMNVLTYSQRVLFWCFILSSAFRKVITPTVGCTNTTGDDVPISFSYKRISIYTYIILLMHVCIDVHTQFPPFAGGWAQ